MRPFIWLIVKGWLFLSRLSPYECVVLSSVSYMRPNGREGEVSTVAGVEIVWIDEPENAEERMEQFNILKRTDFVNQFAPECKGWAEENFLPKV